MLLFAINLNLLLLYIIILYNYTSFLMNYFIFYTPAVPSGNEFVVMMGVFDEVPPVERIKLTNVIGKRTILILLFILNMLLNWP